MPKIQVRRGTSQEIGNIIPDVGEPYYITDTKSFGIGDGVNMTGKGTFDGQWISVSETPLSNGTISPDTEYTYTLSFLPNDGSIYEVIGYIAGRTLTTSGNYFAFYGYSSLMANGLLKAITRTSAYDATMGSFNFIIGSDRKFWFKDTGSGATNVTLGFRAYRRIGTNA